MVVKLSVHHLEGLLKHRSLGSTLRVSDSIGLGWGPRVGIANRFPDDADTAGLENHSEDPLLWNNGS